MFADEIKYFSEKHSKKKTMFLTYLILGFILVYIFGPKMGKHFCPAFVRKSFFDFIHSVKFR